MKEIELGGKRSNGKVALVDDADFDWLSQFNWSYSGKGYAITNIWDGKNGRTVLMHRLILNTPEGMETDHKNNNGLDNQRENLRIVTSGQNKMNMRKRNYKKGSSSKYKGVCFNNRAIKRKWRCNVGFVELGSFATEIEAAKAYDTKVIEMYGEIAVTNFSR